MFWKRCSRNISERIIRKSFLKGGKTVFFKNDGVQEKICRGAGRSCHQSNGSKPFTIVIQQIPYIILT